MLLVVPQTIEYYIFLVYKRFDVTLDTKKCQILPFSLCNHFAVTFDVEKGKMLQSRFCVTFA